MRILITGSRGWTDEAKMAEVLGPYFSWDNTLVSGHCPAGADAMAEKLWAGWLDMDEVTAITEGYIDIYPADWSQGKGAGFARNAIMVRAGADICLAFACWCRKGCDLPPHYTHGTEHCASRAEDAGIPVTWTVQDAA